MMLRNVVGLLARPWAITPEGFETVCAIIDRRAAGVRLSDDEIQAVIAESRAEFEARHAAALAPAQQSGGSVAVISLYGTITPRPVMSVSGGGGAPLTKFMDAFRQADADPNVRAILLDIDSPGGSVEMVAEAAAMIAGASTPVTAIANTMAGSAAYYLASQADEIVASPSALVGSIGVFARHVDESGALEQEGLKVTLVSAGTYKTEGNPYEPLSETARESMQAMVDEFYGAFVDAVASGRGVSSDEVRSGFGQGRILTAPAALAAGMVDRIDTFDATVDRLLATPTSRTTFAKGEQVLPFGATCEATGHSYSCLCADCSTYFASLANTFKTSPVDPAERPSGADKPAPVDGRIARLLNGR
jgi:signal peptide peptidase SppA